MNKNIKASIITILVMVIIPFILGYITALPNDCVVNIYLVGLGAELLIFSLIGVSYTIFQYIKKKMKDEYIIINKSQIEKRIEELEKDPVYLQWEYDIKTHNGHSPQQRKRKEMVDLELNTLKEILSDLTPLIPEIEKAFDAGFHKGYNVGQADAQSHPLSLTIANHIHNDRQDYIANLKLDI